MQGVIIAVVTAVLWTRSVVSPEGSRIATLAALVLMVVEGVMVGSTLFKNKLTAQNTLLPVLFFLFAMSIGMRQTPLTPVIVGTFFLILCLRQLMVTGTLLSLPIEKTFGSAACLSVATLFCPAMVVFLLPLVMIMLNYSLYSWRDWTMLLLGLAAPYIPVELYYYLTDRLFYNNYLLLYSLSDIRFDATGSDAEWVMSVVFITLTLVSTAKAAAAGRSQGTNYSKNSAAILFLLVGSILFAAYSAVVPVATQAFAIPFAFSMTMMFQGEKKKEWIWDVLMVVVLVSGIIYNIMVE